MAHHTPPKWHPGVHQSRYQRSARPQRGRQPPPGQPRPAGSRLGAAGASKRRRSPADHRRSCGPVIATPARPPCDRPARGSRFPAHPAHATRTAARRGVRAGGRCAPAAAGNGRYRPGQPFSAGPRWHHRRAVAAARWHRHLRERAKQGWSVQGDASARLGWRGGSCRWRATTVTAVPVCMRAAARRPGAARAPRGGASVTGGEVVGGAGAVRGEAREVGHRAGALGVALERLTATCEATQAL